MKKIIILSGVMLLKASIAVQEPLPVVIPIGHTPQLLKEPMQGNKAHERHKTLSLLTTSQPKSELPLLGKTNYPTAEGKKIDVPQSWGFKFVNMLFPKIKTTHAQTRDEIETEATRNRLNTIRQQEVKSVRTMHDAIEDGSYKELKDMLRAQDPNLNTTQFGETPLHTAARTGDTQATELLLESGAYRDSRNLHGQTAYDVAQAHEQTIDRELNRPSTFIDFGPKPSHLLAPQYRTSDLANKALDDMRYKAQNKLLIQTLNNKFKLNLPFWMRKTAEG